MQVEGSRHWLQPPGPLISCPITHPHPTQGKVGELQQQYVEAAWGGLLALLRQDAAQPLPPGLAGDKAARQAVKDKWAAVNKALAEAQAQQVGCPGHARASANTGQALQLVTIHLPCPEPRCRRGRCRTPRCATPSATRWLRRWCPCSRPFVPSTAAPPTQASWQPGRGGASAGGQGHWRTTAWAGACSPPLLSCLPTRSPPFPPRRQPPQVRATQPRRPGRAAGGPV